MKNYIILCLITLSLSVSSQNSNDSIVKVEVMDFLNKNIELTWGENKIIVDSVKNLVFERRLGNDYYRDSMSTIKISRIGEQYWVLYYGKYYGKEEFESRHFSEIVHPYFGSTISLSVLDSLRLLNFYSGKMRTYIIEDSVYVNAHLKRLSCNRISFYKMSFYSEGEQYYSPYSHVFSKSFYQLNDYVTWAIKGDFLEAIEKGKITLQLKKDNKSQALKGEYLSNNYRIKNKYGFSVEKGKNGRVLYGSDDIVLKILDNSLTIKFEDDHYLYPGKIFEFSMNWTGDYCLELNMIVD